jgi:hypothetical protein
MSSLQSSEGTQVNEGAEVFSKLESEIGELVRRDAIAPRPQQGNDNELNVGSLEHTQANEGAEVFSKLKSEIGELVRRDATARPPLNELNVGLLVQKVSGTSVQEVEKLIAELQMLRGKLQNEAARVQREVVGHAALLQDARKSIGTIRTALVPGRRARLLVSA